ncbi:transposase [Rhizobium mongolense]|uniref:transposase n=1 Tax=Rhizobium mongolense TaxID=57676 RepID=UPI001ABFF508
MAIWITEAGFDVVCIEARQVNGALSAMRNKTDKHDARGIAQLLRLGWYSRVHVKSVEITSVRRSRAARSCSGNASTLKTKSADF